jgi:protoporphyrinogen/coproporphyrinogen III oxidase
VKRVVIAGGGIAGLSIAWALRAKDPSVEVRVLERSARAGGNIRTEQIDGYTCEWGPDGFLDNAPATLTLVEALGLASRLLPSNDAARRRFIVRGGRLCEVPSSIGGFLRTPLLSPAGKLRIACEPFAKRRPESDESIHDFASRRIGEEAASVLVDPMVSGIFAGDASALSLRGCFPRMWQLEEDYGGLFRALLATRRTRKPGSVAGAPAGRLTSFVGGMAELTDALTDRLGDVVRTSMPVLDVGGHQPIALAPGRTLANRFAVATPGETIEADAVVLSGPCGESAAILRTFDPVLTALLQSIPSAPLAVVCLGYDGQAAAAAHALDGFGFLVPRTERIRILGALWETSIYRHRAPAGKVLLRVMIGGATDPEAATLPDGELLEVVRRDLAQVMGLATAPEFVRIIRHARGIPQYVTGHLARMHQIDTLLQRHAGLHVAGNSYRGVSINSCIADADRLAATVLASLANTTIQAGSPSSYQRPAGVTEREKTA